MATQQILFAETIAGMKKAFKRKAYESDSDSEIESYSNRGNKLKKRARFAHKGQLVPNEGPSSYREYVEYGGVRRTIIHRNPPLIDEEGYEIDSDDDDERIEEAEALASEMNPYANVQLEHILAPLTSTTGLTSHPTLSKPFISKTLTKLVDQSCDSMRKENYSLWQVRHLLTSLCGDHIWAPCEVMVTPQDVELYRDDHVARYLLSLSKAQASGTQETLLNGDAIDQNGNDYGHPSDTAGGSHRSDKSATEDADVSMLDTEDVVENGSRSVVDKSGPTQNGETNGSGSTPTMKQEDGEVKVESEGGDKVMTNNNVETPVVEKPADKDTGANAVQNGDGDDDPATNALVTELRNGGLEVSVAAEALERSFVHPIFITPPGIKPDRNISLPEQEAEDIRRLLALYVQKQEEVCRGAKKLFLGLLRAEKLRQDVWHWSKAEAHSGPNRDMSDGEDWYDKEEWGLTEDLKKGQDEEEEDTQTTGKKTRNRRT